MALGRILALDVGSRRIGLALSDPGTSLAQPLFTLHRTTLHADIKSMGRFLRRFEVSTVVVGLPLHADGRESAQSTQTRSFAESLFAQYPGLTHHFVDERLTTREAHALLDQSSTSRQAARHRLDRKDLIDQVAATLILQAFLDQQAGPRLLPDPDL